MKPNLIAASMALAMLLALGGCSDTGSLETNTVSPSPSATNGGLPNNAGGTANNNNGTANNNGTGTTGSGTDHSGGDTGDMSRYGDYYAGRNGNVNTRGAGGALDDAGDAMRDAAHDVGRAARDIF